MDHVPVFIDFQAVLWIRITLIIPIAHPHADPDADVDCVFYLFDVDAHPDPTIQPHADPDPDSSFQLKTQTLGKVLNRLIFNTFLLVICTLMRIQFQILI